jgi:hypothetical protein
MEVGETVVFATGDAEASEGGNVRVVGVGCVVIIRYRALLASGRVVFDGVK